MRGWVGSAGVLLGVAVAGTAAALASPERTPTGWNIVGVSGSYVAALTAPGLTCAGAGDGATRTVSGTYRTTFTGASMNRSRRFRADVTFNTGAAGPAGMSAPIALSLNRRARETVQTRTVVEDDDGNTTCTVASRPCSAGDRYTNRSAQNKLTFQIISPSRLRVYSRVPYTDTFTTCNRDAGDPDEVWPADGFKQDFAISKVNTRRAVWRMSWSGRVRPNRDYGTGTTLRGTLSYRLTFTLVRNPGTPRAYCRILCRRP